MKTPAELQHRRAVRSRELANWVDFDGTEGWYKLPRKLGQQSSFERTSMADDPEVVEAARVVLQAHLDQHWPAYVITQARLQTWWRRGGFKIVERTP